MREFLTTEVTEVYTEERSLEPWGGLQVLNNSKPDTVRYFTTQYREAFRCYLRFFPDTTDCLIFYSDRAIESYYKVKPVPAPIKDKL